MLDPPATNAATPRADDAIVGLLVRMRTGDMHALATVYETWFDRAVVIAQRLTKLDEAFCLDIAQDSMMTLAKKPPKVRGEAQFAAWLGRVVCNRALDRIKSDARRTKRETASSELRRKRTIDTAQPDDIVAALRRAMRSLKDDDALALVLRFDKNMTLAGTAAGLGITRDAAHGKVRRAMTAVGKQIEQDETNETNETNETSETKRSEPSNKLRDGPRDGPSNEP